MGACFSTLLIIIYRQTGKAGEQKVMANTVICTISFLKGYRFQGLKT